MLKTKRNFFCTYIVALFSLLCTMNVHALTEGDWEYEIRNGNEIVITGYKGTGGDVIMPETIRGFTVVEIDGLVPKLNGEAGHSAKGIFESIKSLTLPDTIRKINLPYNQYYYNIKEMNLPKNLIEIGELCTGVEEWDFSRFENINFREGIGFNTGVFSWNKSLKKIILPTQLYTIPGYMFSNCENLEEVVIPETVYEIGKSAFCGCKSIKNLIFPKSLKKIGYDALNGCYSLKEIILPYGVEEIPQAFVGGGSDKYQLRSIYIPDTVKNIFPDWSGIDSHFIWSYKNLDELIVYCSEGSYAEEWMKKDNVSYLIDNSVNDRIIVLYNGLRISFHAYGQGPTIVNNRTLVPLRSIFETMGATVEWDETSQTATASRGNTKVSITIGSNKLIVNGKETALDVNAQIINGRTMVPIRAISEAFKAKIEWIGSGNTIMISE